MTDPPSGKVLQVARRARAARAYAGLGLKEFADLLEISTATLRRLEQGERPASSAEVDRIARLTSVPEAWLRDGFGTAAPEPPGAAETRTFEEIRRLREAVDGIAARLDAESRWEHLSTLEVAALTVGLAASDRDGGIDHTGKALHAELEAELERRVPKTE